MPLQIIWQPIDNQIHSKQINVPVLNAYLQLSMVGEVVVDAAWLIDTSQTLAVTEFAQQVQQYLLNPNTERLTLQLKPWGTDYSNRVWQALLAIPLGQVLSYSQLATQLTSGPRAVAQACRNNPYAGIIPCHRVVAKHGVGGFMGQSKGQYVEFKQRLLEFEQNLTRVKHE